MLNPFRAFDHITAPDKPVSRLALLFGFILITIVLSIAIQVVCRELMFSHFVVASLPATSIQPDDVERMRIFGIRFDARSATLLMIPLLLVTAFLGGFKRSFPIARAIIKGWSLFIFFLMTLFSIANYLYIVAFNTPLDLFVFNFLDEEPQAVLVTVWQDYPVILATLCLLAITTLIGALWSALCARLARCTFFNRLNLLQAIALTSVALLIFVTLARGSLTSRYPLRRNNAQVSVVKAINNNVLNGSMAIYYAWRDRTNSLKFAPVDAQKGQYLLKQTNLKALTEKLPVNPYLAENRPNVAFFIMESMGYNMLSYDREGETDLLGNLRPHFQNDWLFKRFVSSDTHTIQSVAQLLFLSPVSLISTSRLRSTPLPGTPFETYKKAGYRTFFITSGTTSWENMTNYLPVQYVDEVYDQTHLMDIYGLTDTTEWGVPDHYAFDFAADLLKSESDKPLFVVVLSTTNHPPYHIPQGYEPFPMKVPEAISQNFAFDNVDERLNTVMLTFQSSTDALGRTISRIKSEAPRETVIGATADHHMLNMKPIHTEGHYKDNAVPFYVWASEGIKNNVQTTFDPLRPGSHKDIFPTLYALSLSNAQYTTVGGRNMLAPVDDPARAFGFNVGVWIDEKGAYPFGGHLRLYPWVNNGENFLTEYNSTIEPDQVTIKKIRAYSELDFWQLNMRACGTTDNPKDNDACQR